MGKFFRFRNPSDYICIMFALRFKIPDVTERHPRDMIGRTLANNLVYTIWAVFGGFILHFLLCNYLIVLLRPRYEEPLDTVADLIKRNITPFMVPYSENFRQMFASSSDENYQELSRRLIIVYDEDCKYNCKDCNCDVRYFPLISTYFFINKSLQGHGSSSSK